MEPIYFHIDVNSAFLSWTALERLEQGDSTDLRLIPSIVGGDSASRHGIVLAKSIPAKAYHIETAEPVASAFRKCPNLVMAAPDHTMYHRRSADFVTYLQSISPDIEQASIDECYMDYTPISDHYSSPIEAASYIKDQIYTRFGFTVNIGISNRKVLAKMASDFKKPNLVHTLFTNEIQEKMWPLPISSLFMCGHSSVDALRNLEILTIGDLAKADPAIICAHLKSHGKLLWDYANGIDSSTIGSEPAKAKGIGNSTTLSEDVTDLTKIRHCLLSLSESVSRRLRADGFLAGMVSVEIKYADFQSVSHQTTLPVPSASTDTIYQTALSLFHELWNDAPIRLLGVRTSKLSSIGEPVQLSIFDMNTKDSIHTEKKRKLDSALDSIRDKYGSHSVVRGSFYTNNAPASNHSHEEK